MGCGSSRVHVIGDDAGPKKKVEEAWTGNKPKEPSGNLKFASRVPKNDLTTSLSSVSSGSEELNLSEMLNESRVKQPKDDIVHEELETNVVLPNSLAPSKSSDTLIASNILQNALMIPRPSSPLKPILKSIKLPIQEESLDTPKQLIDAQKNARFNVQVAEKEHKHIKGSPRYVDGSHRKSIDVAKSESIATSSIELSKAIVIDNGSGSFKIGFSGDLSPTSFSCVVGKPKAYIQGSPAMNIINAHSPSKGFLAKDNYIGSDAQSRRAILSLKYPIDRGLIIDFEEMESVWEYAFSRIAANPREHPILMTEPAFCPRRERERAMEIMFETFECPAYFVNVKATLGLYSTGRTTGTVLHVGDQVTESLGVYEGSTLAGAYAKSNFSGRDITDEMIHIAHGTVVGSTEREVMREIKERHAYISQDFENEEKLNRNVLYKLPDDNFVEVGNERFKACEGLFRPESVGLASTELSVQKLLSQSLSSADDMVKQELYENIVVTGGTTLLPGFANRLLKELNDTSQHKFKVHTVNDPHLSAWKGGSVLSQLSTFNQMAVTRDNYQESGPVIVRSFF